MRDERDEPTTLIQVVPWRGLEPNGVADYSSELARALAACSGLKSVFLSGTPSAQAMPMRDEWKTVCLPRRQAQCMADTMWSLSAESRAQAVLLHFSGYGYQKRGVPLWLVESLRIWRRGAVNVPLLTLFHELYATGRPWQSSFWLSPLQKQVAGSILNLSSAAMTTSDLYSKQLLKLREDSDIKITAMPVFSNMGEPGCGLAPSLRSATAVVFGLDGGNHLFGTYRAEIERIISALGIKTIFDVGPRSSAMPRTLAGVPVISKGVLPQRAVSELLQHARFGFIAYRLDLIGKSGRLAAYAAHGVIPIVFSKKPDTFDGLQPSRHFLDGLRIGVGVDADELAWIQCELWRWYASHSLKVQAEFLANYIRGMRCN